MILIFLGSLRATIAVFFSIPLSLLTTFFILKLSGSSVNSMVPGGLALALSRLIDNSVVVLENIFRHMEEGESPVVAAENGGKEVALPVLAGTLTTVVVFFPVTMLYGVSKFLFSALALAVVISLFASYFVALTVVPLFCARFIKSPHGEVVHESTEDEIAISADPKSTHHGLWSRFNAAFTRGFDGMLHRYDRLVLKVLEKPWQTLGAGAALLLISLCFFPLMGLSFFPRTDAGQFVISFKAPSGTKLEATEDEATRIESIVRRVVSAHDLGIVVTNIGVDPGFSALFSPNAAMHTGFTQVALAEGHKESSFRYIDRVKAAIAKEIPEVQTFYSSGSLVDGVLNMGAPAPIDVRITGNDVSADYALAPETRQADSPTARRG